MDHVVVTPPEIVSRGGGGPQLLIVKGDAGAHCDSDDGAIVVDDGGVAVPEDDVHPHVPSLSTV